MHIVAEKGIRLDLGNAEEHSKKWALALLLQCHYDRLPPAKTIDQRLQEFKANWESEKNPGPASGGCKIILSIQAACHSISMMLSLETIHLSSYRSLESTQSQMQSQ